MRYNASRAPDDISRGESVMPSLVWNNFSAGWLCLVLLSLALGIYIYSDKQRHHDTTDVYKRQGLMLKPMGQFSDGVELCRANIGLSSSALLTSRSEIAVAGRDNVHPAGVPRCDSTRPTLRSLPSKRRMTTGLVRTLAAMLSEVAGPPPSSEWS